MEDQSDPELTRFPCQHVVVELLQGVSPWCGITCPHSNICVHMLASHPSDRGNTQEDAGVGVVIGYKRAGVEE